MGNSLTEILLIFITFLLLFVLGLIIFLLSKSKKTDQPDFKGLMSTAWIELGLGEKLGAISDRAKEMQDTYKSFEQMLKVHTERGYFGELSLKTLLSDSLPKDMHGFNKEVFGEVKPDAYINSTFGIICIDSKFPLVNYRKILEANNEEEKKLYKKSFREDVEKHLKTIASKYIRVEKGTAAFAFAYIPVESVAYYLLTEETELLLKYVKQGVQLVSPLTLAQKIELIKIGVIGKKLSEDAEKISKELDKIGKGFDDINKLWKTLSGHISDAYKKSNELDAAYKKLYDDFSNLKKTENSEDIREITES